MGSIPNEIIEFFNWPNPPSCITAFVLTQPLTERSTRSLPGSKGQPVCNADNLTPVSCLENVGASTSHNPVGLHGLLQG
jgi:hypothetical protein